MLEFSSLLCLIAYRLFLKRSKRIIIISYIITIYIKEIIPEETGEKENIDVQAPLGSVAKKYEIDTVK